MRRKIYAASIMLMLSTTTPAIAAPTNTIETAADEMSVQEQMPESMEEDTEVDIEDEDLEGGAIHAVDESDAETTTENIEDESNGTSNEETTEIAAGNDSDGSGIHRIEEHQLDEEGRATIETQFPEDAVFPYQITLSGGEGEIDFTVEYNGQQLLIKPGAYKVKSVRDGNNKKLTKGARLVITQDTDVIYLDFNNPNESENKFNIVSFLITNFAFVFIAIAGFIGIKKYCAYMGLTNGRDED